MQYKLIIRFKYNHCEQVSNLRTLVKREATGLKKLILMFCICLEGKNSVLKTSPCGYLKQNLVCEINNRFGWGQVLPGIRDFEMLK